MVFGVKDELIATIEARNDGAMPDGQPSNDPWHLLTYNFRMKPGQGTAPQPMMPENKEA